MGKSPVTSGRQAFSDGFHRQIWAFMASTIGEKHTQIDFQKSAEVRVCALPFRAFGKWSENTL